MRRCRYPILLVALVAVVLTSVGRADAPRSGASALDRVKALVRKKDYTGAVDALRTYLNASAASVGDPAVDEAKRMTLQVARLHAASLDKSGRPVDGAQVLSEVASIASLADDRDGLLKDAKELLRKAFTAAGERKTPAQALAIADAFAARFPDEPPLVAPADRLKYEVDALQANRRARPEYLLGELKRLRAAGATDEQLKAAGVIESDLVARLADDLFARGWYQQAASYAQAELALADAPPDLKTRLAKASERALSAYVEACQRVGNARLLTDAVTQYADPANPGADPAKLAKYKAAADKIAAKLEPKPLAFVGKFVEGDGTWADDGSSLTIADRVQIGNDKNNRGGEWKEAKITVAPGTVIRGGTLIASHGKLEFKGLPDRPVVLLHMTIECDYTASVSATNVVFIDCLLRKSGNWFWNGGFSSKWELADCMLVRSKFDTLARIDYGIKLQRCTFVDCDIPDRSLTNEADKDNTGLFRDGWNTLADCQFYRSTIRPSLLWANGKSAYVDCAVAGESEYASKVGLDAEFYLPADDATMLTAVTAATRSKGAGRVTYRPTPTDVAKLRPSPLWRFVPPVSDVTTDAKP